MITAQLILGAIFLTPIDILGLLVPTILPPHLPQDSQAPSNVWLWVSITSLGTCFHQSLNKASLMMIILGPVDKYSRTSLGSFH